jgi:hypothetical protein
MNTEWKSVVINDHLRDIELGKNVNVYYKWDWNKSHFDINSVIFRFDDFNYGRWTATRNKLVLTLRCNCWYAHPIVITMDQHNMANIYIVLLFCFSSYKEIFGQCPATLPMSVGYTSVTVSPPGYPSPGYDRLVKCICVIN